MLTALRLRSAGAILLACVLTLACSGDSTAPRVPAAIVLIPNQPKVPQGLTVKLTATVVDVNGREIPRQRLVFSSSDSALLTVDAAGNMHSVGPLGIARVTADLNGLTSFVDAEISQRIVSLAVTPESLVLNRGLSDFLSVALQDFEGNSVFPTGVVTFTPVDPTLVTVDQFGTVQAASNKSGRTTIRVAVDSFTVSVPVRVDQIPASITTNPVNVVLQPGGSQQISVTVRDRANLVIQNPVLSFTSGAPGVFTVSSTGLVQAVAASGSGAVTIRVESLEHQVGVFVGNSTPVAVTHTTNVGTALYEADFGPGGQLVVSAPPTSQLFRGTLPAFTLPTTVSVGTQPLGVAVNHAGTRAYVAAGTGLGVFDLVNNTVLPTITIDGGGTKLSVVVSANDQTAYVGTNQLTYVVDLVAGQVVDSLELFGGLFLALHPTQPLLYAGEGLPREFNLTTRTIRTFSGAAVKELAVSPDGTELYGADEGPGQLRVFSVATGQLTQSVPAPGAFGLAASANLIVVTTFNGAIVLDRASRVPLATLTLNGIPRRPAINAAENVIVVPNEGGWLDYIQ